MIPDWRPTTALAGAASAAAAALLLAALLHRADLAVAGAPFVVALAVGLLRRRPDAGFLVPIRVEDETVTEGDRTTLALDVPGDDDVDVVQLSVPHDAGLRVGSPGTLLCVLPGERIETVVLASRWGRPTIGPVTTLRTAGHGLLRTADPEGANRLRVSVLPERSAFEAIDSVPHAAGLVGIHPSRQPGSGVELLSVRPFVPGDRLRKITWPVSLRTGRLHVVATTEERDTAVQLLIDSGLDLAGGEPRSPTSLDRTVRAAATLAEYYIGKGDRVGLVDLASRRPGVPLRGGRRHLRRLLEMLLDTSTPDNPLGPRPYEGGTDRRLQAVPPRALVVVFSTLLDDWVSGRIAALAATGHTVLVLDTLPPGARPPYPSEVRDLAFRLAVLRRDALRRRFAELGVPVVPWRGSGSLDEVLRELNRYAAMPRRLR